MILAAKYIRHTCYISYDSNVYEQRWAECTVHAKVCVWQDREIQKRNAYRKNDDNAIFNIFTVFYTHKWCTSNTQYFFSVHKTLQKQQ